MKTGLNIEQLLTEIQRQKNASADYLVNLACADTAFNNVWYCPENNNPLLRCPFGRKDCPHLPDGFPFAMCPCHQTNTPYDYQKSIEKIDKEQARAARQQYMELTGGVYCACVVGSNGYQGGWYEVKYDVDECIRSGCKNPVCAIRKQPRDLSRVNVFYDVRRTWITQIGFLKERRVEVTKGVKVFPKPVSRTDAEIWMQTRKANFNPITSKTIIDHPKKTSDDRSRSTFPRCTGNMASTITLSFTMMWRISVSPGVISGTCYKTCRTRRME